MEPFPDGAEGEHEQVVLCHDAESGLRAIVAIHSTVLGPALGGPKGQRVERAPAEQFSDLRPHRVGGGGGQGGDPHEQRDQSDPPPAGDRA